MSGHGILFNINSKLYLKDPQKSDYGQRILKHGIILIDSLGFEAFTFKKLAIKIQSAETSIYRYFQNKHMLLLYLTSWYWEWVNYLIDINTRNIKDPLIQLQIVIHNIVNASTESPLTAYINEHILHNVVIKEGSKAYHVHSVDDENQDGFYESYNELVSKVATVIKTIAPEFPYSKMLASNLFEMANNQIYFAIHLPKLTDLKAKKTMYQDLEKAMNFMAFKLIQSTAETRL